MPRVHTDRLYEGELRKIREMLLMMGAKVEEMLSQAMRALIERDSALAEKTLYIDRQINRLEIEVDDLCLRVLARRQPVASDLRFVTMALKVVTDLERRSEEHTSELQSRLHLVCRLLLEKKKIKNTIQRMT